MRWYGQLSLLTFFLQHFIQSLLLYNKHSPVCIKAQAAKAFVDILNGGAGFKQLLKSENTKSTYVPLKKQRKSEG